jgi:hypothetical protein
VLDGQDPVAYVLSSNVNRRHMTKGQRAMAVAMVCKETLQSTRKVAGEAGLSHQRIHHARTVLRHTPDAAALVRRDEA